VSTTREVLAIGDSAAARRPLRTLLVEDSEDDARLVLHALRRGGFHPTSRRVQTAVDLQAALDRETWDVVISDFRMPSFTGLDALRIFRSTGLDIPFILISGTIGEALAVDAMKAGASDYIMKQSLARLAPALERELRDTQQRAAHRRDANALADSEERFRQMAASIRDVFFLVDAATHRLLYVSPACEEIWGCVGEGRHVDEQSWADTIHPDDRASTIAKYNEGMTAGSFAYEYRIVRPDGAIRWVGTRGFPVRDEAGAIVRIAGTAEDITERKRGEWEIRKFVLAMDTMTDAIYLVDRASMRFIHVNQAACRMQDMTCEALLALGPAKALGIPGEELERAYDAIIESGVTPKPVEMLRNRKDGSAAWIEFRRQALRSEDGWMIATLARDVAARRRAEDKVKRLNRVYAVLSGINTLIVRVRDRDELFKEACRIAIADGGLRMAWIGIVDRTIDKVVPIAAVGPNEELLAAIKGRISSSDSGTLGSNIAARAIARKEAAVANNLESDPQVVLRKLHLDAGIRSMAMLPLIVADDAVGVFALYSDEVGFFDEGELKLLTQLAGDISHAIDHIEKQERLDYLAFYDSLTRLANRTLFLERVAQYMRSNATAGRKLAVLLIDLEGFKNINDSFGQSAGDELLRQVAAWLIREVGDANLLARVGADHFAVALPEMKQDETAARVVEKLMDGFLEHPFQLNDAIFRVSAKAGIAVFPDGGTDSDALFRNAEAALKKAKTSGERYLVYTHRMTEMVAVRLTMENQLREALEREEFVLHYQPKVSLATRKLVGVEALIRWNDPRSGLVPPAHFIPILEETGLIHEVGRWALRKAIADYTRWRAAGMAAMRIAVNVSPMQMRNHGFIAEVEEEIAIHPGAAAGLELELTESVIMSDVKHSIATLKAIRAMGVTIAIDDFGTGFSSLSYLAKLPVDTLKIDRSFVSDMTASSEGLALVSTIINLAHSLKLNVVAEGVETEEQSRLLRLLDCDEMQGYHFSQPLPCEIFEARFLLALPVKAEGVPDGFPY